MSKKLGRVLCILFLTCYQHSSVLCENGTLNGQENSLPTHREILVLNKCLRVDDEISEHANETSFQEIVEVPGIAVTTFAPILFRLNNIKNLPCPNVEEERVIVHLSPHKLLKIHKTFYDVNGTIMTDPEIIIYDYKYPENNNISARGRISQINNLFSPKGMLKVGEIYYHPEEYCLERITDDEMILQICKVDCGKNSPCVPICCPLGEVFDFTRKNCYFSGENEWRGTFYSDVHSQSASTAVKAHYHRTSKLNCTAEEGYQMESWPFRGQPNSTEDGVPLKLFKDGSIKYIGPCRRWETLDAKKYCVTGIQKNLFYSGKEEDQILFFCTLEFVEKGRQLSYVYSSAMLTSSVFLFLTAAVYISLWEKHNVHGWSIVSLVISMFFMFVFLAASHLMGLLGNSDFSGSFYCVAVGALAHFFFLSTFCWLSIVNLDIWWTLRNQTAPSTRSKGFKRFCWYALFAWGGPISVIVIGFTLEHLFPHPESLVVIPDYGRAICFLSKCAQGFYLYYILGGLLVWNAAFSILTCVTFYQSRKETSWSRQSSTSNQKSSFLTFVKLFVIMGVTWCFESISWWLDGMDNPWYWVVLDIANILQAIGIFIIFVCDKKILNQLQTKYPTLNRFLLSPASSVKTTTTFTRGSTRTHFGTKTNSVKREDSVPMQNLKVEMT